MKEQDAAHSLEKKEICQYETWVNEYFGLPENFPERAMSMSFDYGQIVNMLAMFNQKRNDFHKQNVADVMFERDLELTRLRSELEQDEILGEQNAFHLVKALDLIDECHHYLKANPPDKTKMTYTKWQSLVEETDYMREFNSKADHQRNNEDSELTSLRSELQQERKLRKELINRLEKAIIDFKRIGGSWSVDQIIKKLSH